MSATAQTTGVKAKSSSIRSKDDLTSANRPYQPYGGGLEVMFARDSEVVMSGPAGTGKSRACLEKLHLCALKYPGMRGLIVRKTRESLTEAALVTYEDKVLPEGSSICAGAQRRMRQGYHYPNGSEIIVGGLDKAQKVMSTEYDMIYVQEAIELEENDWEACTTRLRNGGMPYQQLFGDTNPDAPTHWLKRRAENGQTRLIESRHEDNPSVTPEYLAKLDALTGVRYFRLRKGLWVAAEGMIYDGYDPAVHLINRDDPRYGLQNGIPADWPRFWGVDFGYTNPFVWQAWAQDPDGRLFRYREIYKTHSLVEDHAEDIKVASEGDPFPQAILCDHDAEDRATLERKIGLSTTAAYKDVSPGIQAVASRLKVAGDGKARIFFLRDSLYEVDPELKEANKPTCTEEEIGGYVWDVTNGQKKGEAPVKRNDHGLDDARYVVAYADAITDDDEFHGSARPVIRAARGWNESTRNTRATYGRR